MQGGHRGEGAGHRAGRQRPPDVPACGLRGEGTGQRGEDPGSQRHGGRGGCRPEGLGQPGGWWVLHS